MNDEKIKQRAAEVLESINHAGMLASSLRMPSSAPDKDRVSWVLLRAAFDDGSAISSLIHHHGHELAGSAHTLLRPMNEKFKRGAWFYFCASDEDVTLYIKEDKFPKRNVSAEIEAHPPFDQYPAFTGLYDNVKEKFHSFTHGGNQILGAYTLGTGIGAAFPEEAILGMLAHVEAVALTAIQVMCMVGVEHDPQTAHAVMDAIRARHLPPTTPFPQP